MAKSLQTLVNDCCQILEQDFANLFTQPDPRNPAHSQAPEVIAREAALDCFLEIAAMRCIEVQSWTRRKMPLSDLLTGNHIKQKMLRERQLLQAECPLLSPFFLFQNGSPSEAALKKVYVCLREAMTPEKWRTEHILGWMYQYALQGRPEQKQHGQFYTSEAIVEYIVSQTFRLAFDKHIWSPSFSVLDLACGAGSFALKAFEKLYTWYIQANPRDLSKDPAAHILEHQLFLVDNDPRACRIAVFNLYLKARQLAPECQIRHINIVCADALRRWEQETSTFSHAQQKNAKTPIRKFFTKKYHIIVGNPPYIVINRSQTPKELLKLYKSYQSAAFKINTFALFIERGIELLKPRGILGMIVPNTLLTQVYFEPLRQYILTTSRIHSILDIKRVFERAFVENCIIVLQREFNDQQRSHNRIVCQAKIPGSVNDDSTPVLKESGLTDAPVIIPQHHFEHAPFNMFHIHIDEHTYVLMEKIAQNNPKLGELCESHDGFNPGNAKTKFIVHEPIDAACKKVLNGKDIGRYRLNWGGLYVRYNKSLLARDDIVRWGHMDSLEAAKILTRQTADRLIGTFEPGMYYTTNSIHTTIFHKDVQHFHLKYILALLNSTLMTWYYRKLISEVGQVFSQVKLINLRQLPIKPTSDKKQQEIVDLVETLLQLKTQDSSFYAIDASLDRKIYRLYQLTPDEIEVIERL